jgi:hypothetical protein
VTAGSASVTAILNAGPDVHAAARASGRKSARSRCDVGSPPPSDGGHRCRTRRHAWLERPRSKPADAGASCGRPLSMPSDHRTRGEDPKPHRTLRRVEPPGVSHPGRATRGEPPGSSHPGRANWVEPTGSSQLGQATWVEPTGHSTKKDSPVGRSPTGLNKSAMTYFPAVQYHRRQELNF